MIIKPMLAHKYNPDKADYPDSMHYRYDNVITLRTFSKIQRRDPGRTRQG